MENLEIRDRIFQLEEDLKILEELRDSLDPEKPKMDVKTQWLIRYGLFECIQIVIDIACHLVSKYNLGNPKSYAECVELLRKYNYIPEDLEDKLVGMIGLRNKLIHEYLKIDLERLVRFFDFLNDFKEFAKAVEPFI